MLKYVSITDMQLANTNLGDKVDDNATVKGEDFRLKLEVKFEFVAAVNHGLFTSSFATSCENEGLDGLKNDIRKVVVTSNKDILDTPAGNDLNINEQILVYQGGFYDDRKNQRISFDEWLDGMNNGTFGRRLSNWYFEFRPKIESTESVTFKFVFEFSDNTSIELMTAPVNLL